MLFMTFEIQLKRVLYYQPVAFKMLLRVRFGCSLAAKRKNNCVISVIGSIVFITMYWNLSSIHFFKQEFRERIEYITWTYECEDVSQNCIRKLSNKSDSNIQSLRTCQVSCGAVPVWPLPTGRLKTVNRKVLSFKRRSLKFRSLKAENFDVKRLLIAATDIFLDNLKQMDMPELKDPDVDRVDISVLIIGNSTATTLKLNTDESYKMEIACDNSNIVVNIKASTFFGARHAIETLSQLIWFDDLLGLYRILSGIKFEDIPAFKIRGIMLDTVSNFIPIKSIKRTLTAMSMNKLNTFHWHMTEVNRFSFCYKTFCKLAEFGAGSFGKVYSTRDLKEIIDFALVRGIRVVLEIDSFDELENAREQEYIGEDIELNDRQKLPIKNSLKEVHESSNNRYNESITLKVSKNGEIRSHEEFHTILDEIVELPGATDLIHIGEEKTDYFHREDNLSGDSFLKTPRFNFYEDFQKNSLESILNTLKIFKTSSFVLWSDTFDRFINFTKIFDNHSYIVHVGSQSIMKGQERFMSNGYRVIISHSDVWFLDRLPVWSSVYSHRPWQNYTTKQIDKVLGAEVCLWTDTIDENSLDPRLWPNAAAFAEVVWTNPTESHAGLVADRLDVQRHRMLLRGVIASPIQPEWCSLNPGKC